MRVFAFNPESIILILVRNYNFFLFETKIIYILTL